MPITIAAIGIIPIEIVPFQITLLPLAIDSYRQFAETRAAPPKAWLLSAIGAGLVSGLIVTYYETRGSMPGLYTFSIDSDRWTTMLTVLVVLALAGVNSLVEEGVWREGLAAVQVGTSRKIALAIGVNTAFGVAHWPEGFPSGADGAFLAGVFGLAAYGLRCQSGDSRVNYVFHFVTDVLIILYVL